MAICELALSMRSALVYIWGVLALGFCVSLARYPCGAMSFYGSRSTVDTGILLWAEGRPPITRTGCVQSGNRSLHLISAQFVGLACMIVMQRSNSTVTRMCGRLVPLDALVSRCGCPASSTP